MYIANGYDMEVLDGIVHLNKVPVSDLRLVSNLLTGAQNTVGAGIFTTEHSSSFRFNNQDCRAVFGCPISWYDDLHTDRERMYFIADRVDAVRHAYEARLHRTIYWRGNKITLSQFGLHLQNPLQLTHKLTKVEACTEDGIFSSGISVTYAVGEHRQCIEYAPIGNCFGSDEAIKEELERRMYEVQAFSSQYRN
jgi:hypothetical protein